jgi:hypothetical protein
MVVNTCNMMIQWNIFNSNNPPGSIKVGVNINMLSNYKLPKNNYAPYN